MGTQWNYQNINVKLCYRSVGSGQRYHVIVPEGERFSWNDFVSLKDFLRSKFPNSYNKELYLAGTPRWFAEGKTTYQKDQPVFEYNCSSTELIAAIEEFATTRLDLGDRQFSFATIDYDFISAMKEVPLDMIHAGETIEFIQ